MGSDEEGGGNLLVQTTYNIYKRLLLKNKSGNLRPPKNTKRYLTYWITALFQKIIKITAF